MNKYGSARKKKKVSHMLRFHPMAVSSTQLDSAKPPHQSLVSGHLSLKSYKSHTCSNEPQGPPGKLAIDYMPVVIIGNHVVLPPVLNLKDQTFSIKEKRPQHLFIQPSNLS